MEVNSGTRPPVMRPDNDAAIEIAFKAHFSALYAYAYTLLQDNGMAEEIVQTVFLKLWESRKRTHIQSSLRAYLYKSVYNESLNYLKRKKVERKYMQDAQHTVEPAGAPKPDTELRQQLQLALQELPEKCRTVFQLSRFEELKYQEIADRLGISIKTVEVHMGKALKFLRFRLADFLPVLMLMIPMI